jgi:hypothetical protein
MHSVWTCLDESTERALRNANYHCVGEYTLVLARPEFKIRKSLRQQLPQLIKSHTCVVMLSFLRGYHK